MIDARLGSKYVSGGSWLCYPPGYIYDNGYISHLWQGHFLNQFVCTFLVCLHLLWLEFREITHSWQINEITCVMKEYFSVILYSYVIFFSFQNKLHQGTNTYNYHGYGSTVGRSDWSNSDELLCYYDSNDVVVI